MEGNPRTKERWRQVGSMKTEYWEGHKKMVGKHFELCLGPPTQGHSLHSKEPTSPPKHNEA